MHRCDSERLTASKLERTRMGIHREVLQLHRAFCWYGQPAGDTLTLKSISFTGTMVQYLFSVKIPSSPWLQKMLFSMCGALRSFEINTNTASNVTIIISVSSHPHNINGLILSQKAGEPGHVNETVLGWLSAMLASWEQGTVERHRPCVAQRGSTAKRQSSQSRLDYTVHTHAKTHTARNRVKYKILTEPPTQWHLCTPILTETLHIKGC